ncbi:unnamed protein product, partial [marine sediment metagenome]
KNYEPISVVIKTDRHGKTVLSNVKNGLIEYKFTKNNLYYKKILRCPIILLSIYKKYNVNHYKLKLNGDIVCLMQSHLIDYILDRNLFYISGKKLRDSVDIILKALEEKKLKKH